MGHPVFHNPKGSGFGGYAEQLQDNVVALCMLNAHARSYPIKQAKHAVVPVLTHAQVRPVVRDAEAAAVTGAGAAAAARGRPAGPWVAAGYPHGQQLQRQAARLPRLRLQRPQPQSPVRGLGRQATPCRTGVGFDRVAGAHGG